MRSAVLVALALIGCRNPVHPAGACHQTSEFGNFGCAVIAGSVVNQLDAPVSGAIVGPGPGADAHQFSSPFVTTGADGRFAIRLLRMLDGDADSASLWVQAVRPAAPGSVTQRDSTLVRLRVAPVGTRPDTVRVTLRLGQP